MATLGQDNNYYEVGAKAIRAHETAKLDSALAKVATEQRKSVPLKSAIRQFDAKVHEFAELFFMSKAESKAYFNANPYLEKGTAFVQAHFQSHSRQLGAILKGAETDSGIPLKSFGMDAKFAQDFLGAVRKKGLFGKGSGLDAVVDTLMRKAPEVSAWVGKSFGSLRIDFYSVSEIMDFTAGQLGITSQGVRDAYVSSGFTGENGMWKFVERQLLANSGPYLDMALQMASASGLRHSMTGEKLISGYKEEGFFARKGPAGEFVRAAFDSLAKDEYVYTMLLSTTVGKDETSSQSFKVGAVNVRLNNHGNGQKAKDSGRAAMIEDLVSRGVPQEIAKQKLLEVYDQYGILGENGIFGYLHRNADAIYSAAKDVGLVSDKEITATKKVFEGLARIKGHEEIKDRFKGRNQFEKYAVALGKKSEELGVEPAAILSDVQYAETRKEILTQAYGSLHSAFNARYWGTDLRKPIREGLEAVRTGSFSLDAITEAIGDMKTLKVKDAYGFGGLISSAARAIERQYVKKTLMKRIESHLVLASALIEERTVQGKEEFAHYGFEP